MCLFAGVAALEVDSTPSQSVAGYVTRSVHQAEKNLRLHCFSKTGGQAGQISADVLEVISEHFAEVPDRDEDPRRNARRLIALGTALHCQQDAYSHVGFGGSCGSYLGSCFGHAYETFLDQVVFGVLKKHHFNPDHPGASGQRLLEALQGTVRELAARRPRASFRSIPTNELVALYDDLRRSGLELPDEVRRDCNRYIAGTCKHASLASTTVDKIPEPRFPRLNPDASPHLVRADGSYQLASDGGLNVSLARNDAERTAGLIPNYNTRKVQLSHWSQLLALPLIVLPE